VVVSGDPTVPGEGGLLFLEKGEVVLTGQFWDVVVELNVTELHEGIAGLRAQTGEVGRSAYTVGKNTGSDLLQVELATVLQLEDQLKEHSQDMLDMLPHRDRPRRGLFDAGGRLIKVIFGNPDDLDLERIEENVGLLQSRTGTLLHVQKEQLSITRALNTQLGETQKRMASLVKSLHEEVREYGRDISRLKQKVNSIEQALETYVKFSSTLRNLEIMVLKAVVELENLRQALELCAQGKLSSHLISPREMSGIFRRVREMLPSGVELLAGDRLVDMHIYREVAEVHAIAAQDVIRVIVRVPLKSTNNHFALFRVEEIPARGEGVRLPIRTQRETEYFLVDPQREHYVLASEGDIAHCQGTTIRVCPAQRVITKRNLPSCTSAVFFREFELAQQLCERKVITDGGRPLWFWDDNRDIWIFSVPQATRLTRHCRGSTPAEEMQLEGEGELSPGSFCQLRTPYQVLPSTGQGLTTLKLEKAVVRVQRPPLVSVEEADRVAQVAKERPAEDSSPAWVEDDGSMQEREVRLSQLLQESQNLQDLQKTRDHWRWGLGGSGVFLGILALGVVGAMCWCRRRPSTDQPVTLPQTPAVVFVPTGE